MIFYHGSKQVINKPNFKGSNPQNDYGPAFYTTLSIDAAKLWACKNDTVGIVNKYFVKNEKIKTFKILDLTNKEKYSVLNWIAILMHFRKLSQSFADENEMVLKWLEKYYLNVENYDLIIGFRADDNYFKFPLRFITNDLSYEDLEEVFMSGNLGVQYVFTSERAIKSLVFKRNYDCDETFLGKYYSNVKKASEDFDVLLRKKRDPKKTYVLDLMRLQDE